MRLTRVEAPAGGQNRIQYLSFIESCVSTTLLRCKPLLTNGGPHRRAAQHAAGDDAPRLARQDHVSEPAAAVKSQLHVSGFPPYVCVLQTLVQASRVPL